MAISQITTNSIADGTVIAADIADGSVTAAKMAANTITASVIGTGVITSTQIAGNTITATQIGAGVITATTHDVGSANGTGALIVPSGTTAQRPGSTTAGYIRFNTTLGTLESANGSAWANVGSGAASTGSGVDAHPFMFTALGS